MPLLDYLDTLLNLATQAKSICRPNPAVGAIIVKNGTIIGQGHTQKTGEAHAEIEAINSVKKADLVGSEIWVTLAPCNFYGRTPPCTEAIKAAGINSVTFLLNDPNPEINKNPLLTDQTNEAEKIKVTTLSDLLKENSPKLEEEILNVAWKLFILNLDFYKTILTHEPTITIKYAMSLDGKMSNHQGESKWISSATSRKQTHLERSRYDAIMIGDRTFFNDNPRLNVRLEDSLEIPAISPLPIIIINDRHLIEPKELEQYYLLQDNTPALFIVHEDSKLVPPLKKILEKFPNKKITFFNQQKDNQWFSKIFLTKVCQEYNIQSIYAEGGAELHSYLITSGLVDRFNVYVAPKLFIGPQGRSPFTTSTNLTLPQHFPPLSLWRVTLQQLENDILWTGVYQKEVVEGLWQKVMPDVGIE